MSSHGTNSNSHRHLTSNSEHGWCKYSATVSVVMLFADKMASICLRSSTLYSMLSMKPADWPMKSNAMSRVTFSGNILVILKSKSYATRTTRWIYLQFIDQQVNTRKVNTTNLAEGQSWNRQLIEWNMRRLDAQSRWIALVAQPKCNHQQIRSNESTKCYGYPG